MSQASDKYYQREFWVRENLQYAQPHFRLEKAARLINRIVGGQRCELLDVGCGPATLKGLLRPNVEYYGIDIAIHSPAANLREVDFVAAPISFGAKEFDVIVAQGVFEYIGRWQDRKFAEIARILRKDGIFIASYVNFGHRAAHIYAPYNNIQSFRDFSRSLTACFDIRRVIPTSHQWHHREPRRQWMKRLQMKLNIRVPVISQLLAVEYFFVCSKRCL
jgi:SAM-dependent methyltransferase